MTAFTKPLSEAQLLAVAPQIFATSPHDSRSSRYAYVSTQDVLKTLRKAGFLPVQAFCSKKRAKNADQVPFAKHLVRLRQRKFIDNESKVNDLIPDVILTNSHDGSSSFTLEAGLYRLVCSNGMVVRSQDFGSIKVMHSGADAAGKVLDAAKSIAEVGPRLIDTSKLWDSITLPLAKRIELANAALILRYHNKSPLTAEQVLEARRNEDEAPTLWRTFNILQENLMTGGQTGKTARGRATTTRGVTSVNNTLGFNRGLWEMADKIARAA